MPEFRVLGPVRAATDAIAALPPRNGSCSRRCCCEPVRPPRSADASSRRSGMTSRQSPRQRPTGPRQAAPTGPLGPAGERIITRTPGYLIRGAAGRTRPGTALSGLTGSARSAAKAGAWEDASPCSTRRWGSGRGGAAVRHPVAAAAAGTRRPGSPPNCRRRHWTRESTQSFARESMTRSPPSCATLWPPNLHRERSWRSARPRPVPRRAAERGGGRVPAGADRPS